MVNLTQIKPIVAVLTFLTLPGCTSVRPLPDGPKPEGKLYLLRQGLKGESWGFRALGVVPVVAPDRTEAQEEIAAQVTPERGGKVLLLNQIEERTGTYFIIASAAQLRLTADAYELVTDEEPQPAS